MIRLALLIRFLAAQTLNPVNLIITLLFCARLVSMCALHLLNKWLFCVLILFYLGGILVIFAYIVSLFNAQKPELTLSKVKLSVALFTWAGLTFTQRLEFKENNLLLTGIYQPLNSHYPPMMGLILLLALLVVVKISNFWQGPIKPTINE